jgi:hypothetical protein
MSISAEKLNDPYTKQLCIDIEASNLLQKDLTFGALCRARKNYYDVSEQFKKSYLTEFNQIKRRNQDFYIKVLDKFGIKIGPALQREFHRKKKPSSTSKSSNLSESENSKSESEGTSESKSSVPVEFKAPAKLAKKPTPGSVPKSVPPKPVPKELEEFEAASDRCLKELVEFEVVSDRLKGLEINMPSRPLSGTKTYIMFSPVTSIPSTTSTPSTNSADAIANVLRYAELLEDIRQEGTLEYPYIHHVNMEFPERNCGFDIVLVNDIEHQGYTRDGFHIRKSTAAIDSMNWEAFVPFERFHSLAHRALICSRVRLKIIGTDTPNCTMRTM